MDSSSVRSTRRCDKLHKTIARGCVYCTIDGLLADTQRDQVRIASLEAEVESLKFTNRVLKSVRLTRDRLAKQLKKEQQRVRDLTVDRDRWRERYEEEEEEDSDG